jgi:CBS domain containing-hemolysin-like protein
MTGAVGLGAAVVLIVINAFFVGAEFALVSARRDQIEPLAAGGSRAAQRTLRAMAQVSRMLAGAQLGITLCSLALGAIAEPALAHLIQPALHALHVPEQLLHPIAFALALLVVVLAHMLLGEMVPKNLALAGPDRMALLLTPPLAVFVRALGPAIAGFNALANVSLRLVGVQVRDEVSATVNREEVALLVAESAEHGLLEPEEQDLLTRALAFEERTAAVVLLERSKLVTVKADATSAEVERLCAATGFSRFPVVGRDANLIGYLHVQEVLRATSDEREEPFRSDWIRPLAAVRLEDPLHVVLATMRRARAHLGGVKDAAGAQVGVVALEDVLEELVGEVRDATRRTPHSRISP